jgi:DNA-binding GntR family transcriptional regulator
MSNLMSGGQSESHDNISASERVYRLLREAILQGTFKAGTRLKEAPVARSLGASRTPVRAALIRLDGEGLVTLTPNRGALVREVDDRDIDDSFQLRALLQGFAAAQAAQYLKPPELEKLERLHEDMAELEAGGPDEQAILRLQSLNEQFHDMITKSTGNRHLMIALDVAVQIPGARLSEFWHDAEQRQRSMRYHAELLEAFRAGDATRADAIMKSHIHAARVFVIRSAGDPVPVRRGRLSNSSPPRS